jgi:DUF971 family protein
MESHVLESSPREIKRTGEREITVTWNDDHVSVFATPYLREACGCAACVDEWTGRTKIVPGSIPETVDVIEAELVGAYAVRFIFSDAHSDGIYTYRRLRQFCPCPACRASGAR